jgi:RNA polymerase sigma-70 factor (ECF subfamily)
MEMFGKPTLVAKRGEAVATAAPAAAAPAAAAPARPADRERLQRMFVAHHALVWRTLRRRGLAPDIAADVTQQTFLVAAERLADINPDSERAFLVGTALRMALAVGRKAGRLHLEQDMDVHAAHARNVSDEQAAIELCDLALSKIDDDTREVFVLFEMEGLSSPEIAALLEIPLGTVASRLRRARAQFRTIVARLERVMQREGSA